MEICLRLGLTHPVGVLHYLAMESVPLFSYTEDIQCARHRAIKVTELRDKAIAIRAMAPSESHVRVYMIAVGGTLQNPNLHPQRGRGTPFTH